MKLTPYSEDSPTEVRIEWLEDQLERLRQELNDLRNEVFNELTEIKAKQ